MPTRIRRGRTPMWNEISIHPPLSLLSFLFYNSPLPRAPLSLPFIAVKAEWSWNWSNKWRYYTDIFQKLQRQTTRNLLSCSAIEKKNVHGTGWQKEVSCIYKVNLYNEHIFGSNKYIHFFGQIKKEHRKNIYIFCNFTIFDFSLIDRRNFL